MTMTSIFSTISIAYALLSTVIGVAIGLMHFSALQWNARMLISGNSFRRAIGLHVCRIAMTVIGLYLCARIGLVLPLVLLGILIARQVILIKTRRCA